MNVATHGNTKQVTLTEAINRMSVGACDVCGDGHALIDGSCWDCRHRTREQLVREFETYREWHDKDGRGTTPDIREESGRHLATADPVGSLLAVASRDSLGAGGYWSHVMALINHVLVAERKGGGA